MPIPQMSPNNNTPNVHQFNAFLLVEITLMAHVVIMTFYMSIMELLK